MTINTSFVPRERMPHYVLVAIDDFAKDGNYHDATNFRAFKIGDEEMEATFRFAVQMGCCESYEGKLVIGDEEWIIGFDYNHTD